MKLLSLNVGLFEANNEKLSELITEQSPDILCLQEVVKKIDASALDEYATLPAIDQVSNHLKYSFFAPNWVIDGFERSNFHGEKSFNFQLNGRVEIGQYCKSRFPIAKAQSVFVQNHFSYISDWSNWPEEDYRSVQVIDLNIDGKQLRLLNYHGIWSQDKQGTEKTLAACKTIRDLALESEHSIICGDFNLLPDTESMKTFGDAFRSLVDEYDITTTRPASNELSDKTRNVVDYIFVSEGVEVENFEVLQNEASDHLPLWLECKLA